MNAETGGGLTAEERVQALTTDSATVVRWGAACAHGRPGATSEGGSAMTGDLDHRTEALSSILDAERRPPPCPERGTVTCRWDSDAGDYLVDGEVAS
jgi:hypothetical protein